MFLLMGIDGKVKQCGVAHNAQCPVCFSHGTLHICNQYLTPHIFFIPTFRLRSRYLATCAHCASLMEVEKDTGRAFERDPDTVISAESMHVQQNNMRPRCASCGAQVSPGQNFCPHCGQRL